MDLLDMWYSLKYEKDIEKAKQLALYVLKEKYKTRIQNTDSRILQYQKRKVLGILDEDDENDYRAALDEYRKWTEWYKQKKQEVENAQSIEDLAKIDIRG